MGFAIADDTYVTCAHVVADSLADGDEFAAEAPEDLVTLRFAQRSGPDAIVSANVQRWRPCIRDEEGGIGLTDRMRSDIAILEIIDSDKQKLRADPLSLKQHHARLAEEAFLAERRPFHAWGAGNGQARVEGYLLPADTHPEDEKLFAQSVGAVAIVGGCSGAPAVLLTKSYRSSIVMGMFERANEATGQARVTPAPVLYEIAREFGAKTATQAAAAAKKTTLPKKASSREKAATKGKVAAKKRVAAKEGAAAPADISSAGRTIATTTQWLIGELNRRSRVRGLVEDSETKKGCSDQKSACALLLNKIKEWQPGSYVISGQGGTGKSVVLREITLVLAREFLISLDHGSTGRSPLPIAMNLKRTMLSAKFLEEFEDEGRKPDELKAAIAASWIKWANAVIKQHAADTPDADLLNKRWLEPQLRTPTVVIFDAVDEFLNRYPEIELEDLEALAQHLIDPADTGIPAPVMIIFGVRLGTDGLEKLSRDAPIRIGSLSRDAAIGIIGKEKVADLLDKLGEPYAEELVLTPLILHALEKMEKLGSANNPTRVLERAIEALLHDDPLDEGSVKPQPGNWSAVPMNQRLGAITAVAWAFAELDRDERESEWISGEQSLDQILSRTQRIAKQWKGYKATTDSERTAAMIAGFQVAADKQMLEALLRRSVFEWTGRFSFAHRSWMETCIARYVAFAIEERQFDPIRTRTYYAAIFRRTGELLEKAVDGDLVDAAIDEVHSSQFVIGNIGAILGYSLAAIDTSAFHAFKSRLHEIPPLARHVLISTLCRRAIRDDTSDASASSIARALYPKMLERCITQQGLPDGNPATASLAWCYHKRLGQLIDQKHDTFAWPFPLEADAPSIFRMTCPGFDPEQGVSLQVRTLQKGYMEAIRGIREDPDYTITGVHYILMLVLAQKEGASVRAANEILEEIFASDSRQLEAKIRSYCDVPEVAQLLDLARNAYRGEPWKKPRDAPIDSTS